MCMIAKEVKLQGHMHRREKVYSKWVQIVNYYQEHGAKETIEEFSISRSHLYYIIKEMNKKAN